MQRRWRVHMGLGPHGGLHSPQVLHSDHEPSPAMRGGVYWNRISGFNGVVKGCSDMGSTAKLETLSLNGLPTLTA